MFTALREILLQTRAYERAKGLSSDRRRLASEYAAAADECGRLVPRVEGGPLVTCAITLGKAALEHLIRAHVALSESDVDDLRLRRLVPADVLETLAAAWLEPDEVTSLLALLRSDDPLYFQRLTPAAQESCGRALDEARRRLRARIDVRSPSNVRATGIGRIAAVLVAAGYVVYRLTLLPNVAFHKTVTLSTHWPGTCDPASLVDGVTEGRTFPGTCDVVLSTLEPHAWATIDLGRTYDVRTIKVFNRNDADFDGSLPYVLELSEDGTTFEPVARRDRHFGNWILDPPWRVRFRDYRARFVRVSSSKIIALAEIEVYGR